MTQVTILGDDIDRIDSRQGKHTKSDYEGNPNGMKRVPESRYGYDEAAY